MTYHVPVLKQECIDALELVHNDIIVDATLGGGGHSEAILQADCGNHLYSIDQDPDAIAFASSRLAEFKNRHVIMKGNFADLRTLASLEKLKKIDGILYDLGISSYQIDEASRGFSFGQDGKLDMRMSPEIEISAYDVINSFSQPALAKIFREFGEEKDAFRIAGRIIRNRKVKTIETTRELAIIIEQHVPGPKATKAKARIFQAIRIYVNKEMEVLRQSLKEAVDILNPGGRIVVITYHSLEDRIVKQFFQQEQKGCICPPEFPICNCGKKQRLKIVNKKPILPTNSEIIENSRARSAKLRIAERV